MFSVTAERCVSLAFHSFLKIGKYLWIVLICILLFVLKHEEKKKKKKKKKKEILLLLLEIKAILIIV